MPKTAIPKYTVHDLRITDRVLAATEPDAGDVVFLGRHGAAAFPFAVVRRVSGPNGWYVDACEIVDPLGVTVKGSRRSGRRLRSRVEQQLIAGWERKYEVEGISIPTEVVDEVRHVTFPHTGTYTLRYSIFDDHIIDIPFEVVAEDPPYGIVVPGPLDAALDKSTIAWVTVPGEGKTAKDVTEPVWYGYEKGRVYVLVGPNEQNVPGLTEAPFVTLTVRSKDQGSHQGDYECAAFVLPKGPGWDALARDVLIGRRLNLTDGDKAVDRWKKDCEIVALTPLATRADA